MHSVGACRQCAVKQFKDENDTRGRIVMACMTPAADGTRISIQDPEAREFRESVIEWLMVNHPHDCPVCDEGGECHLQDMTLMTGHVYRKFRFKKRTYRNQYLGPFVNHEMNRCIQCYRCVRFYRDFAGGRDLDVFGIHDRVYFGRQDDGVLESEFSGNLVEVCPTGVFTDKTLKLHYTRKWDLQTAPSVCVNCSLGCNTIPGERYGTLRRIRNGYNREVNGYFLCDRGRYGYDFVNVPQRIREPLARETASGPASIVTALDAVQMAGDWLSDRSRLIGVGSPRASLESNFALRTLVGPERFYAGVSENEHHLVNTGIQILQESTQIPSLHEVETADAVLVLGEDLTNTAPMLAYAVRQLARVQPRRQAIKLGIDQWNEASIREVIQQDTGPVYIATPTVTKLDDVARWTYNAAPDDLARFGFAVAHALEAGSPEVSGLPEELRQMAENIATSLRESERPIIISGTSLGSPELLRAAANVARALESSGKPAGLCFTFPECNSVGLRLMGGESLQAALEQVRAGRADTLVVLENDLYRRAEAELVEELLQTVQHVIVLDHLENKTTEAADLIFPASTFAEGDGTLVNNEGRAQRFFQVFLPAGHILESWRLLRDMNSAAGRTETSSWSNLDEIMNAMAAELPVFAQVPEVAPRSGFRIVDQKIPREPHRYSGRTAMLANINVSEPKPPDDPDAPFNFSMEGYKGKPPAGLIPRYWAPGWNSVQSLNKFQDEVAGPLMGGDPGRRLIKSVGNISPGYFQEPPSAFNQRENEWMIVPLYHIFGSEELSILTPGIAQLAPQPYIAINPDDATRLGIESGEPAVLTLNHTAINLPVRILPSLPGGCVGYPSGLQGLPRLTLPAWGQLSKGVAQG